MTSGYSAPGGPHEGHDGEDEGRWPSSYRDRWPPVTGQGGPQRPVAGQNPAGQNAAGQSWDPAPGDGSQPGGGYRQPGHHPSGQHPSGHPQGGPAYGNPGGYQDQGAYGNGYGGRGVFGGNDAYGGDAFGNRGGGDAYGNRGGDAFGNGPDGAGRPSVFGDPAGSGGQHAQGYRQPAGPPAGYQQGPLHADPGRPAQPRGQAGYDSIWEPAPRPPYPGDPGGDATGPQGGGYYDAGYGGGAPGAQAGWGDPGTRAWQQPGDQQNPQWPNDMAITGQHVLNTDAFAVPGDGLRAAQRRPSGGARVRRVWPQRVILAGVIIVFMIVCWYWIFPMLETVLPSEF